MPMRARRHDPVSSATASYRLLERIVEFTRLARDSGFQIGIQEELDALKVAKYCHVLNHQRLRWGLRSLMCSSSDDWARFDTLYDTYWLTANRQSQVRMAQTSTQPQRQTEAGAPGKSLPITDIDQAQHGTPVAADQQAATQEGASAMEALGRSDFRLLSDEQQMRQMEQLIERLAKRLRRRLIRRQAIARQGCRIHLRRTIRRSLKFGGTPLELAFTRRRQLLPRLILLLDVSRSMSLYSYFFLRFARGIVGVFKDAHAFAYHTQLVPITEALRESDIHKMKQKLALISSGWSGGTRIGESLRHFNQEYGHRLLTSRSIVMMVSDGLDTGSPEILAQQLGHIKRRAKRLVWLNPLLGRAGYQPIAAGMQAALPLLDWFAPAHNLESLAALESYLIKL